MLCQFHQSAESVTLKVYEQTPAACVPEYISSFACSSAEQKTALPSLFCSSSLLEARKADWLDPSKQSSSKCSRQQMWGKKKKQREKKKVPVVRFSLERLSSLSSHFCLLQIFLFILALPALISSSLSQCFFFCLHACSILPSEQVKVLLKV